MGPDSPAVVEAVVMTGGMEIPYRRAGRGPTLLILAPTSALFEALAPEHRVFEPIGLPALPDPDRATLASWLRGLIDGLGLDRPTILADAAWLDEAHAVAAADPHRCGPVLRAGPIEETRAALRVAAAPRPS